MGLPIKSNGVKNHMKCHITRDHVRLGREVHIRVETRYGHVQHHVIPRILTTKVRKRPVAQQEVAEMNVDGGEPEEGQT